MRYKIVQGSASNHCCFDQTIIDSANEDRIVCETIGPETALEVCQALNAPTFESLAKENGAVDITDQEFAERLGLQFWIDGDAEFVFNARDEKDFHKADDLTLSLWDQLRHAYGFKARGSCNSKHLAQIDREFDAETTGETS